jgi:acyl-coenzyme A thioesterase PaaI-like protein
MAQAIQDYYPDDVSHCYGCGRLNEFGLQIKTYWEGEDPPAHPEGELRSVTRFLPRPYHTAVPGYVYGGLIASLIDCHSTAAAAAALYHLQGRELGSDPPIRCLTASLHVDYVRPTPLGVELEVRGRVKEITGRRVTISSSLYAADIECARGEVVAVQVPDSYLERLITQP